MKLALFFTNVCAGWLPVAITFKIFDYYFQKSCPWDSSIFMDEKFLVCNSDFLMQIVAMSFDKTWNISIHFALVDRKL